MSNHSSTIAEFPASNTANRAQRVLAASSLQVYSVAEAEREFPGWVNSQAWTADSIETRIKLLARQVQARTTDAIPITIVYNEADSEVIGIVPLQGHLLGINIGSSTEGAVHRRFERVSVFALAAQLAGASSVDDVSQILQEFSHVTAADQGPRVLHLQPNSIRRVIPNRSDPKSLMSRLLATYDDDQCEYVQSQGRIRPPQEAEVRRIVKSFLSILFPGYRGRSASHPEFRSALYRRVSATQSGLSGLVRRALAFHESTVAAGSAHPSAFRSAADQIVVTFFDAIPEMRRTLDADVRAAYRNDPALPKADHHLVPLTYPGLYAVSIYRLAHELQLLNVPYLPRMMTEMAHRETGIDIHPGARIGRGFFIDHGTGVVIGETAVIGNGVTLYQSVTIGSLNFPQDASGNLVRGAKRHPTIHGGTTIFANAAVLGNIEVGHGSKIGANVSLRKSVPPESIVRVLPPQREVAVSVLDGEIRERKDEIPAENTQTDLPLQSVAPESQSGNMAPDYHVYGDWI